jgi:hypothetical protein
MNLTVNDAINEYYKLKENYEKTYFDKFINPIIKSKEKSNKEKRVEYSKLPKPICINCKRNVGTIFSTKYNPDEFIKVYSVKCGDIKEPCPLNITFNYAERQTFEYAINTQQKNMNETKVDIIKEKNNVIFGYTKEDEALEIFNKVTEKLKDVSELLGYVIEKNILKNNNPEKYQLLIEKQDEFNKIYMVQFKNYIDEEQYLDAVKYYKTEMIPLLNEIEMLKYETNIIEYNELMGIYHLIQKKNSLLNQETYIEEDDKIINFVKGITSKKTKTTKVRKVSTTKTRKLKPTIELVQEEEEEDEEED